MGRHGGGGLSNTPGGVAPCPAEEGHVRFGSKADIGAQKACPLNPRKRTCAVQLYVRFVPKADIRRSSSHLLERHKRQAAPMKKSPSRAYPRDGEKITRKERHPLLLRASMTLVVAPMFWRRIGSDEVRVRIAPATIAGDHVRPDILRLSDTRTPTAYHRRPSRPPRTMEPRSSLLPLAVGQRLEKQERQPRKPCGPSSTSLVGACNNTEQPVSIARRRLRKSK